MNKTNLFESILKDSEKHTSKMHESVFAHISESAKAEPNHFGIFTFNEIYDADYSEDGFASVSYTADNSSYGLTVNLNFTDVDVETDCDCDNPCDSCCTHDHIRYESTGPWCEYVDITSDTTYTIDEDGDIILEEVPAQAAIDFFTGKGLTVTAEDIANMENDAIGMAEENYCQSVNDDPDYFCDCDNCDCDYDCDCDRWE